MNTVTEAYYEKTKRICQKAGYTVIRGDVEVGGTRPYYLHGPAPWDEQLAMSFSSDGAWHNLPDLRSPGNVGILIQIASKFDIDQHESDRIAFAIRESLFNNGSFQETLFNILYELSGGELC